MKEKKFLDKLSQDTILKDDDKKRSDNNVWSRINNTIDSKSYSRHRFRNKSLGYVAYGLIITTVLICLLVTSLDTTDIDNNLDPVLDPPISNPIIYYGSDLEMVIVSYEELIDIYEGPIEIKGFKYDSVKLFRSKDEKKVNVYIQLEYYRENEFDAPWDVDRINITIQLVDNFVYNYDIAYPEHLFNENLSINLGEIHIDIAYMEVDLEHGISEARTKFMYNDMIYYINTQYFKPFEEGNRLQIIINSLIEGEVF